MNFKIIEDGKEITCNIIKTFRDEGNDINYIIYTDGTKNEDGVELTYASRYIKEGNNFILKDIEKDSEYDLIDNILASMEVK